MIALRQIRKARFSRPVGRHRKLIRVASNHPLILSARRNRVKIATAFTDTIEALKNEIDMKALTTALLHKDWGTVMRLTDVKSRMVRLAQGQGMRHGTVSLRDALRRTYRDGLRVGMDILNGIPAAVKKAKGPTIADSMSFDDLNPAALEYLQSHEMNLITNVSQSTAAAIQDVITRAFQQGGDPAQQAREIRDLIGLDPRLEQAVQNFQSMLESGNYADALTRELRDHRYDSTLASEAALDSSQIDSMVERYASHALNYRATNIARTESLNASNQGQLGAWNQAVQQGYLDPENTVQIVLNGPTPCQICQDIAAMNEDGVGLDETFDVPDDADSDYPPFHVNCEDTVGLRILSGPMAGEEEEE